jgi:hypothetical protein
LGQQRALIGTTGREKPFPRQRENTSGDDQEEDGGHDDPGAEPAGGARHEASKADELARDLTCPVPHGDYANQDDRPERVLGQTAE